MWKKSFLATTVALGGTAREAAAAIAPEPFDPPAAELAVGLDAPQRPARAAALGRALRDVVFAIDEATLK